MSKEIKIINEILGDGIEVVNHSKVVVHYIGKLEDETEKTYLFSLNNTVLILKRTKLSSK